MVGEETHCVSEPQTQEEGWPGLGAVVAEADEVVSDERMVPEPNCGLSVATSEDALSVDLWPELDHVSDGDTPRVASPGSPEGGKSDEPELGIILQSFENDWGSDFTVSEWLGNTSHEVIKIAEERE